MRHDVSIRILVACLAACGASMAPSAMANKPSPTPVECTAGGGQTCVIDVEVKGNDQACTVRLFPAYTVKVAGAGSPKPVQWRISGDARYEFEDSPKAVAMSRKPGVANPWADDGTPAGQQFTLVLKSPAPPIPTDGSITFAVKVIDKQKGLKCAADPIIGNGAN